MGAANDEAAELELLLRRMSVEIADLILRLMEKPADEADWDWVKATRDEIMDVNHRARSEEEQAALCFGFLKLMENAEGLFDADQVQEIRKLREADYRLMLSVQAMNGGDFVDPVLLDAITFREVEAGRMPPDSDFREFAAAGGTASGGSSPRRRNWLAKFIGRP